MFLTSLLTVRVSIGRANHNGPEHIKPEHTKTPAGHFTSNPAGVFIYDMYGRGWRGSGKPGEPDESG